MGERMGGPCVCAGVGVGVCCVDGDGRSVGECVGICVWVCG